MPTEPIVRPTLPPDPRILVARLDSLGDCILSSSFFAGLRQLFPTAHLTGAFSEDVVPLFDHCPIFDRVVAMPLEPSDGRLGLLDPPYDLAICPRWDVDHWSTRQLALESRAPIRVGFDRGPYRHDEPRDGWVGAYFSHPVRTRSDYHEVAKGGDLLHFLGASTPAPDPRLWLSAAEEGEAEAFIRGHRLERFAVLAVAARWSHRVWPVENFLTVIDDLVTRESALRFVVVGGEDALAPGAWLHQMRPETVVHAAGSLPLLASAALIARSVLYIGMDSGPKHMAAAAGVPVVEISCHPRSGSIDHPNSPSRFGAYATRNRVLRPARARAPCVDGCMIMGEAHCIVQVPAADVVAAALSLLERPGL
jgi:ADP-heptose:LPS heptosyltransferase